MVSSLSKTCKMHVKHHVLIQDMCSNLGPVGPSIDYGTMAPSHVRERLCHYNRLHLWFSFKMCYQHASWRRQRKLQGQRCRREGEQGEALVDPKGKALRPPGIIMVYSPTLLITLSL